MHRGWWISLEDSPVAVALGVVATSSTTSHVLATSSEASNVAVAASSVVPIVAAGAEQPESTEPAPASRAVGGSNHEIEKATGKRNLIELRAWSLGNHLTRALQVSLVAVAQPVEKEHGVTLKC